MTEDYDLVVRLQCEVPGVEQLDHGVRVVPPVSLCPGREEEWVVPAPYH